MFGAPRTEQQCGVEQSAGLQVCVRRGSDAEVPSDALSPSP